MISEKLRKEYAGCSQDEINILFATACIGGKFDRVKYLLTSPELKFHADIHTDKEMGLRSTCMTGNLEIVKFLTSSSDLKEHADVGYDKGTPLAVASLNDHIEIVQYFLESPSLKKYDGKLNEYGAFLAACENSNMEIAAYFIYERNIKNLPKSSLIRSRIPCLKEIDEMFSKREFKNLLESELASNSNRTNRMKL